MGIPNLVAGLLEGGVVEEVGRARIKAIVAAAPTNRVVVDASAWIHMRMAMADVAEGVVYERELTSTVRRPPAQRVTDDFRVAGFDEEDPPSAPASTAAPSAAAAAAAAPPPLPMPFEWRAGEVDILGKELEFHGKRWTVVSADRSVGGDVRVKLRDAFGGRAVERYEVARHMVVEGA